MGKGKRGQEVGGMFWRDAGIWDDEEKVEMKERIRPAFVNIAGGSRGDPALEEHRERVQYNALVARGREGDGLMDPTRTHNSRGIKETFRAGKRGGLNNVADDPRRLLGDWCQEVLL